MLLKHLIKNSKLLIHTDVDLDGIGSCKILTEWLRQQHHFFNTEFYINQERVHGINQQYVDFFNEVAAHLGHENALVIILDSSSNETELLKQIQCDVIVIDHHKMQTAETYGVHPNATEWVTLNYISDSNLAISESLSAGMETFEFLRWVDEGNGAYAETPMADNGVYQWAVATLFSDNMDNDKLRNIYWINKSSTSTYKEPSLNTMLQRLGRNDLFLSKSNIGYTLAPAFNRAIRAGASGEALWYALNDPNNIGNLIRFKAYQDQCTANFEVGAYEFDRYTIKDLTNTGISGNYAGLIATKLLDKYSKTSVVYHREGDLLIGSFRGKSDEIDYCKLLGELGFYAQGHPQAFGFKVPAKYMQAVMDRLVSHETGNDIPYLSYGGNWQTKHRIESLSDFRNKGMFWRLGIINSYLSSDINIVAPSNVLNYLSSNTSRTYFTYGIKEEDDTFSFTSFQELKSGMCYLYVENQDKLKTYAKNKWR